MTIDDILMNEIIGKTEEILKVESSRDEKLQSICNMLKEEVPHYDWVGFYLVDGERELFLGPYAGAPTEHTKIGFGEGICGQAADTGKLFLIQDVAKETNYLSCSPAVKSEIVVPIFKDGEMAGELDIDSHMLSPFTDDDSKMLERICSMVVSLL